MMKLLNMKKKHLLGKVTNDSLLICNFFTQNPCRLAYDERFYQSCPFFDNVSDRLKNL